LRELIRKTKGIKKCVFLFHTDGYVKSVIPDIIEIGYFRSNPGGTIFMRRTPPFGNVDDVKRR